MTTKAMRQKGFTLVEILVSLAVSSFVIAGMYSVYSIQQKSYTTQEQVTELQQKIRAAMDFMAQDIRMAGYDPKEPYDPNGTCDGAAIQTTAPQLFSFEYCDVKPSGSTFIATRMTSTYQLQDSNGDGIADSLEVTQGGMKTMLAEGVNAIEFRYLDGRGKETANLALMRTVQVSMLVQATYPDRHYVDNTLYRPASMLLGGSPGVWDINGSQAGAGNPPNDNFHRRLLITSIQLRNNI